MTTDHRGGPFDDEHVSAFAPVRRFLGGAALLVAALLPLPAEALNTCGAILQFEYVAGVNFPQPVPPGSPGDDVVRVRLLLGAGTIQNGTVLNLHQLNFDLDCTTGTSGSASSCNDDGAVIAYGGDDTITTTCEVADTAVSWTSGHALSTDPNEVAFIPSSPVVIPAGTPDFCQIEFDVRVVGRTTNVDGFIEQNAFYAASSCNNMTPAGAGGSGSFPECEVCIGAACDIATGMCGPGGVTTTLTTSTTTTVPTTTTSTTLPALPRDHFTCYPARPHDRFTPTDVTLADRFGIQDVTVLKPVSVCVPVDENGEGIPEGVARLVCYLIPGGAGQTQASGSDVTLVNEFGASTLTLMNGSTLCVPSREVQ